MRQPREQEQRARIALKPIENLVVGSSLRQNSDEVVGAAFDVAQAVHGRVTLVHSLPTDTLLPWLGTGSVESEFYEKWSKSQRDELASQIERLEVALPVNSRIECGAPHRVILDVADEVGADLIVIGASERDRFARVLGGSADRILRRAKCPVLVVRGDWRFPIRRVLAPVDFSLLSADALECGLSFLLQIGGEPAQVELFFAVSELQRSLAEPISPDRFEKFVAEELERFGREAVEACGPELSFRVAAGRPAQEIRREAKRFRADLVVLGAHGQGGVERALLGSVARAVATEAGCAVLFIPPEIALSAAVAEAILEQTEPRWRVPEDDRIKSTEGGSVS